MGNTSLNTMFDKLTDIAREADPSITREMVQIWVGNDGYAETQRDWMVRTLCELENGDYSAQELVEDITQLCQN